MFLIISQIVKLFFFAIISIYSCAKPTASILDESKPTRSHGNPHTTPPPPPIISPPHQTYRNDIIICGTHASPTNYYQFAGQDFNTVNGLLAGDTVAIKVGASGQNFIEYIDLGLGSSSGITLVPDSANTTVVEIGWIGLGDNAMNWTVNGKTKHLNRGFLLTDSNHFAFSMACVGNIEISNCHVNGALMGMQLVTMPGHTYPLSYQRLHSHDNLIENTVNEAEYLGYVNDSPIAMDLLIERDTVLNSGYDGIQTRNTDTVIIRDCYLNGIGMKGVDPHSHGILFGSNSNGGTVLNCKVLNVVGLGIFQGGWGDFVYKCNTIQAGVAGIMSRSSYPEGDVQNTNRQTQAIHNNIISATSGLGIACYYDSTGKYIAVDIRDNKISNTIDVWAGIVSVISNNNSSVNPVCGNTGIIY